MKKPAAALACLFAIGGPSFAGDGQIVSADMTTRLQTRDGRGSIEWHFISKTRSGPMDLRACYHLARDAARGLDNATVTVYCNRNGAAPITHICESAPYEPRCR